MYASAIVKKLTSNPETQKSLEEESETISPEPTEEQLEEQSESYAEFTKTIYDTLFELDRRGYEHKFSFKAQDDGWSDNSHLRTGIAVYDLSARWEALEEWESDPTLHPGDFLNRDPYVSQELRKEFLHFLAMHRKEEAAEKAATSGSEEARGSVLGKRNASLIGKTGLSLRIRGSIKSYRSFVADAAQIYLNSRPGPPEAGDNLALNGLLESIINPRPGDTITQEMLVRANLQLDYRLAIIDKADKYVEQMGLSEPWGQSCQEFEDEKYTSEHEHEGQWSEIKKNFYNLYSPTLFPKPSLVAGRPFYKGSDYVIAAIDYTVSAGKMDLRQCIQALNKLKELVNMELNASKDAVKDLPDIRSKRQRVAQAFGKTLRHLSPVRGPGSEIRAPQSGPSQSPRLQKGPRISPRKPEEDRGRF